MEGDRDLPYPIGKFVPGPFSLEALQLHINDITQLPARLEAAVQDLDYEQLQFPYRPGGWTLHQLVHHICDSHLNAYCRMKLTLTEETPVIKPYNENAWVATADLDLPVNNALTLLHALHQRMAELLRKATPADFSRKYIHPDESTPSDLWHLAGLYAWHGNHHLAHIHQLRDRMNW